MNVMNNIQDRMHLFNDFMQKIVPGLKNSYQEVFDIFVQEGIDIYITGGALSRTFGKAQGTPPRCRLFIQLYSRQNC